MPIVPRSSMINKLQLTDIPSATELMSVLGLRAPQEHADNTDPYNFHEPSNPVGRDANLDRAYGAARAAVGSAYEAAYAAKEAKTDE